MSGSAALLQRPTYKAWTTDETISLKDYLTYATSQGWIDISSFSPEGEYLDSEEIYQALTAYIIDYLSTDTGFSKLLYKYMLQEDTISGQEICLVLYEQGVLDKNDDDYENLASGAMGAYDFMINKIYSGDRACTAGINAMLSVRCGCRCKDWRCSCTCFLSRI